MTTPAARALLLAGCAWLLASSAPLTGARDGPQVAAVPVTPPIPAASAVRPTLDRYCLGCHNDRLRTGGLSLANLDPAAVGGHAELWEKVVRKLRTHEMPPAGASRPDEATDGTRERKTPSKGSQKSAKGSKTLLRLTSDIVVGWISEREDLDT